MPSPRALSRKLPDFRFGCGLQVGLFVSPVRQFRTLEHIITKPYIQNKWKVQFTLAHLWWLLSYCLGGQNTNKRPNTGVGAVSVQSNAGLQSGSTAANAAAAQSGTRGAARRRRTVGGAVDEGEASDDGLEGRRNS